MRPDTDDPDDVTERLRRDRPAPAPTFRGELGRRLARRGRRRSRPAHLWVLVVGFGGAGSLLLLAAAASAIGVGPLAP